MDDHIKRRRTWFVRVFPLWILPWSWKGWLWTFVCFAVFCGMNAYVDPLYAEDEWIAPQWLAADFAVVIIFFIVAFRNSSKS